MLGTAYMIQVRKYNNLKIQYIYELKLPSDISTPYTPLTATATALETCGAAQDTPTHRTTSRTVVSFLFDDDRPLAWQRRSAQRKIKVDVDVPPIC